MLEEVVEMCGQGHGAGEGTGCHHNRWGGHYVNLMQPVLLLLLCERDAGAYGYELGEQISGFGLGYPVELSTVYRYLKRFEEQGLVTSRWKTGETGPARRLYRITPEGRGYFQSWLAVLRKRRDLLDFILARGEDLFDIRR